MVNLKDIAENAEEEEEEKPGAKCGRMGITPRLPWPSHTSDLRINTPVATMPHVWYYSFKVKTGWPGVSKL